MGAGAVANAAEHLAPTVTRAVVEHIAPMDTAMMQSKAGKAIFEAIGEYRQKLEGNLAVAYKAAQTHANTVGPLPQGVLREPHEINTTVRSATRAQIFGAKDEGLAYLLNAAKKERGDNHANVLADHLGVIFHDAAYEDGKTKRASSLVRNVQSYAKSPNAKAQFIDPFMPKHHEVYIPPSQKEATANRFVQATFAPHAAIAHGTSSLITFLADGAVPYTKALFKAIPFVNYENSRALLKTSNALSELYSAEYKQHYYYQQSKFKDILNKNFSWIPDSVGEIIHANRSMPGMSAVRQWNLTVAGMSAKFKAEEMAARVMHVQPGGYEDSELLRLGLNPNKIRAQGGNLTKEDYRTAIFKGADYSAFLESSLQRSQFAQQSIMGRQMMTFHTYITRSTRAIAGSLYKEIANKNPAGIARVLGTLTIIAPEVGNGVHFIQSLANGHGLKDSENEWSQQEHSLHGQNGFMALLGSHVEGLSHLGAFGVATGYTRAMSRHALLNSLAGPVLNALARAVEDGYQFFLTDNNHPDAWKALARDAITDVPSMGLGAPISHAVLPTKQELAEKKPKTAKQIRAAQTRAAHKKPSNNPLRRMFSK